MGCRHVFSLVLLAFLLAGCAGIRMPSDERMLPLLDPEQLPYSVEGRWEPDEAGEVILDKRSFPVSTRSEYILGFGSFRDVENRIVELDIAGHAGLEHA